MVLSVRVLLLFATGASAEQLASGSEAANPIKRVVGLLSKMKVELEAEGDKESDMYDKMVCWCDTNKKEKTKALADADAKEKQLTAEIGTRSARFGVLSAKIGSMKKEVAENTNSLKEVTAIREGEAAKFRNEEKDMTQAITNLRNAISVLSQHQKTQSLIQMEGPLISGLRVVLHDAALKYEELVAGHAEEKAGGVATALMSLKAERRQLRSASTDGITSALLSSLDAHDTHVSDALPLKFAARLVAQAAQQKHVKAHSNIFLQLNQDQPLYESRSSARSAGIYGIMEQMLEEFQAELGTTQKDESKAQEDFKALAAAKTAEISAGKAKLDEYEQEDAGNAKALSDAKEDLTLTRKQRSEDTKFLQNLKLTCNDLDSQFQKRSQTRAAEVKAVAEAISIITTDDNREMLAKSVTLLQEKRSSLSASARAGARRASAVAALRREAGSPAFDADDLLAAWHGRKSATLGAAAGPRTQLSTLAMAVQLDSFGKVKEMIDKMVAQLKDQQAEEVKFKAYCTKELDANAKSVFDKTELKKDLEGEISEFERVIKKLDGEIAEATKEVVATELGIKKASQNREEENSEFQTIVADQRATQAILKKALQKLKDFYVKGMGKAVLAQREVQTPPVKFNSYKTNAGASPVIGLIEQIVEDSKALEAESEEGENSAQKDYERFVKDSNTLIESLHKAITTKKKTISASKGDKAEAASDLENAEGELEDLSAYEADLHGQCDFVLKNFDVRQKARLQEMEAIHAAKAILSGAGA